MGGISVNETEKKNLKFQGELGGKAKVERHDVSNEQAAQGNARLRDIGEMLNPIPKHVKYMGSMAVHIYQSEMIGQVFFMGQVSTLSGTPEETASAALSNLRGDAQSYYGRQRQRKRSGF